MRRRLAIPLLLTGVFSATVLAFSDKPPADVATPVKAAVHLFYDRVANGLAKDNESLFLNRDLAITGYNVGRPDNRTFFQKPPAEFLKRFSTEPKYFVVERIDVDRVHDYLAVSRVEWKTGGARGHSIITWHKVGDTWRIVSFFQDEHFVW